MLDLYTRDMLLTENIKNADEWMNSIVDFGQAGPMSREFSVNV